MAVIISLSEQAGTPGVLLSVQPSLSFPANDSFFTFPVNLAPYVHISGPHPASCPLSTHRYEVCFLNASPLNFSSRDSCSMSGKLLNVSLQPMPASSEPAPDSESPPSAPREAGRPPNPPTSAGLARSVAWGSMLVGLRCLALRWTPLSAPACDGTQRWCRGDEGRNVCGNNFLF